MATGKCVKCGKDIKFGIDGSCKNCGAEVCWTCWEKAGHECPECGDFEGKGTREAGAVATSVEPVVGNSGISRKSLNILAADEYEEYGDDPV
jgi:hypothetical protein